MTCQVSGEENISLTLSANMKRRKLKLRCQKLLLQLYKEYIPLSRRSCQDFYINRNHSQVFKKSLVTWQFCWSIKIVFS